MPILRHVQEPAAQQWSGIRREKHQRGAVDQGATVGSGPPRKDTATSIHRQSVNWWLRPVEEIFPQRLN